MYEWIVANTQEKNVSSVVTHTLKKKPIMNPGKSIPSATGADNVEEAHDKFWEKLQDSELPNAVTIGGADIEIVDIKDVRE